MTAHALPLDDNPFEDVSHLVEREQALDVPEHASTENAENYSALQLFLQIANDVRPGFSLSQEERPFAIRICQIVAGMPLGIELAAAWVGTFSCREIAQALETNLDWLTTSQTDVPERHRNLRAVFDFFWNLLSTHDQSVLQRLSIFRGGFRAEAAQKVAGASMFLLSALVDRSCLRKTSDGRYELHELLRQYAAEKLDQAPGEKEKALARHCRYYVAFMLDREKSLVGPEQGKAQAEIQAEMENVRLAWRWMMAQGKELQIARSMHRLARFYNVLGIVLLAQARFAEAIEVATALRVSAEAVGDAVEQAFAWILLAGIQDRQGDYRAMLESAERAEGIARAAGAQVELIQALLRKGWAFFRLGHVNMALLLAEQALSLSTGLVPRAQPESGSSLNLLGRVHDALGHYEQAASYYDQALKIFRKLGHRERIGAILHNQGENARLRGDYATAASLFQEALLISQELGHRDREMMRLGNLAGARIGLGEYWAAEADLRQVIRIAESGSWANLSKLYCFLAHACLGQGKVVEAATAAQQALALGQKKESQEYIGAAWRVLGMVAAAIQARGQPCDAEVPDFSRCFAESLRVFTASGMESERGRTLREWARAELALGDRVKGEAMWHEARAIFEQLGLEKEIERMTIEPEGMG